MANKYRFNNKQYNDRIPGVHPTLHGKFVVRVLASGFSNAADNHAAIKTLIQVATKEEADRIYADYHAK